MAGEQGFNLGLIACASMRFCLRAVHYLAWRILYHDHMRHTWKLVQTVTVKASLKKVQTMNSNAQRAAAVVLYLMVTTTMKK
jgi:hypothetical protein